MTTFVTVYEFSTPPVGGLDPPMPPVVAPTTVASSGGVVTLDDRTVYVRVCADIDCRIGFGIPAVSSGMNISSAYDNPFAINGGRSRTLQFA